MKDSFTVAEISTRLQRDIEMCDAQVGKIWRLGDADKAREWLGAGKALLSLQEQLLAGQWPYAEVKKEKPEPKEKDAEKAPEEEEVPRKAVGDEKRGPLVCDICGATFGTKEDFLPDLICIGGKKGWGSQPIGPENDAPWKSMCGECGAKNIKKCGFDKPRRRKKTP